MPERLPAAIQMAGPGALRFVLHGFSPISGAFPKTELLQGRLTSNHYLCHPV
jgi:hypothetical protein